MTKKATHKWLFGLLLLTYIIIAIIFVFEMFSLPVIYTQMEKSKLETVKITLKDVLESSDTEEQKAEHLAKLTKEQPMELIVSKNNKMIFTTFKEVNIESIRNIFHDEMTLYKSQGILETSSGTYTVLYSVYHVSAIEYVEQQFLYLTILVIGMIVIVIIAMTLMYYVLIRPLERLRYGIEQLNAYQFGSILEEDVISQEFNRFTQKMNNVVETVSRNYTELELALEFERERLTIMMAITRAFVHNLKTPVHQTLLENEFVVSKMAEPSQELSILADFNVERADKLLKEINEILVLMDTQQSDLESKSETFDFIEVLNETWKTFKFYISNNELGFFSEMPDTLFVEMNKVSAKIIIHNLLSNATKYAEKESEIVLEINEELDGAFEIICRNETSVVNIERMRQGEKLFNIIDNENGFSSGNGLYLLKELTEFIGGSYDFSTEDNIVSITIVLPYITKGGTS